MKKHRIIFVIAGIIAVVTAALVVNVFIGYAASVKKSNGINDSLSTGIHYLNDMDYEKAVAYFNQTLEIDEKNVMAYAGSALAYEGLGKNDQVIQILEQGYDNTENDLLARMVTSVQEGQPLFEQYEFMEMEDKLQVPEDPFDSLKVLGSSFYQWDFSAGAELFGFDYEKYAGQSVDLGTYYDMNVCFDATDKNVGFSLENQNYEYGYRLLSGSGQQIFRINCLDDWKEIPELKEIGCKFKMGTGYGDVLDLLGLSELEEGIYYYRDSSLGKIGYIQWTSGSKKNLFLYLTDRRLLGMQFVFEKDQLMGIIYTCGVPDNARSKVMNWIADIIH